MGLNIDLGLLEEFERHLDPRRPEESEMPARVLGYGEISTVFEIGTAEQKDIAYKRMPIFENTEELAEYEKSFREYIRLLGEEVGLELPPYDYTSLTSETGRLVMLSLIHISEPTRLGMISYAVFCLKKKNNCKDKNYLSD